jgi:hypothetical protein
VVDVQGIEGMAEAYLQVMRDYGSLPRGGWLTHHEIRFFYSGLIGELKEATKPRD